MERGGWFQVLASTWRTHLCLYHCLSHWHCLCHCLPLPILNCTSKQKNIILLLKVYISIFDTQRLGDSSTGNCPQWHLFPLFLRTTSKNISLWACQFCWCSACYRCQKMIIHYRLGILLYRHSYCIQVQVANHDCYKLNRGRVCCHGSCSKDSKVPAICLEGPLLCTDSLQRQQAAIAMINQCKPTTCSCHINVQFFAIQEWHEQGDILMKHISGTLNMANDSTKALGWILHHWHAQHAMGHHWPHCL